MQFKVHIEKMVHITSNFQNELESVIKNKYDCEISYQNEESIYSEESKEEISDTVINIIGF